MEFSTMKINEYIEKLSSKSAVPGGGGTSALVGALGLALGQMVGSLTIGKEKFQDVEPEMLDIMKKSEELLEVFIHLIDMDPEAFEPLMQAYKLPQETPEEKEQRDAAIEKCLHDAAAVPIEVMYCCSQALDFIKVFAEKGNPQAISDAGCAAAMCKAALESAALNVYVNTRYMKDREYAHQLSVRVGRYIAGSIDKADAIYDKIYGRLLRANYQG